MDLQPLACPPPRWRPQPPTPAMSVSCLGLRVLDSRLGVRGLTLGWSVTRTAALGRRLARTVQGEGLGVAKDGGRPCPRSFLLARGLLRLPTTATKVSTTATKAKTTATNPCGAGYKCVGFRVRGLFRIRVCRFPRNLSLSRPLRRHNCYQPLRCKMFEFRV